MGCLQWKEEVTEESAEEDLTGAASEVEVATAGASEGAEEGTGEDTALERWTRGATADRNAEAVPTEGQMSETSVCVPSSIMGSALSFYLFYNSANFGLFGVKKNVTIPVFLFALVQFVHVHPQSLRLLSGASFRKITQRLCYHHHTHTSCVSNTFPPHVMLPVSHCGEYEQPLVQSLQFTSSSAL